MRIVFHGENAGSYRPGIEAVLGGAHEILLVSDGLEAPADRAAYAAAEAIVGVRTVPEPRPSNLRLFQVAGAGLDAIDLSVIPDAAVLCNMFGHEQAIAEYVMAALLARAVPLAHADRDLRRGEWTYQAGFPDRLHGELTGTTIGLLGFGHINQAVARRARAFEMRVLVANRSALPPSPLYDRAMTLDALPDFWAAADAYVLSLPLAEGTRGIVGAAAFAAMQRHAVLINVGRGATVDERALYEALAQGRIGGAVIDTWYRYPTPGNPNPTPSAYPFEQLPNLVMTPHMSGWTAGTVRRRQAVIAANIRHIQDGTRCEHVVRAAGLD